MIRWLRFVSSGLCWIELPEFGPNEFSSRTFGPKKIFLTMKFNHSHPKIQFIPGRKSGPKIPWAQIPCTLDDNFSIVFSSGYPSFVIVIFHCYSSWYVYYWSTLFRWCALLIIRYSFFVKSVQNVLCTKSNFFSNWLTFPAFLCVKWTEYIELTINPSTHLIL